jgi:hypothetical protein
MAYNTLDFWSSFLAHVSSQDLTQLIIVEEEVTPDGLKVWSRG